MHAYQRKRNSNHVVPRFFLLVASAVLLSILLALMVRGTWNMYGRFVEATHASKVAAQELAVLKGRESAVSASLGELSTERGVEAQVRERFGVVKPGEGEIQLVRNQPVATPDTTSKDSGNMFFNLLHALTTW